MRRPHLARLLALAGALLVLAPPAGAEDTERVWLSLGLPVSGGPVTGGIPLAEVTGIAAVGTSLHHDVVLVLDVSGSTLLPSGADIDGDGRIGRKLRSADDPLRNYNPRRLCSDPGDSIRAAEIAAARRFLAGLDPAHTRVGLVVFAETAEERIAIGADATVLEAALDRLASESAFGWGATDLSAALRQASRSLESALPSTEPRQRQIVLLSDGTPNRPGSPERAAREALAAGRDVARVGARVHAFALGEDVMDGGPIYREVAESSGGEFAWVAQPADVVARLARLDLSGIAEIRVENASTGHVGRAVRVSPDGRFDAVVALAPGENRIRVVARGPGGAERRAERVVHFDPQAPADAGALARLRARTQSLALELEVEIEKARGQVRRVELEAEADHAAGSANPTDAGSKPRPDVAAAPPGTPPRR